MQIGCCGQRPVSLQGLLEAVDAAPAGTHRALVARRRLAYTVVAAKAAQAGDARLHARALHGLANLGTFVTSDPTLIAGASAGVTAVARRSTATTTSIPAALRNATQYVTLVASIANLGTAIARSACNGCDTNAINAIDMVVSWIRAILTGSAPSIPVTLSPQQLDGFVKFCQISPAVTAILDPLLTTAVVGLRAGAIRDAGLGTAADVLDLLRQRVLSMFSGICAVPQISDAVAALAAPPPAPAPVTPAPPTIARTQSTRCWDGTVSVQTWDTAAGRWGAPTPPCPTQQPAAGLEAGQGGCTRPAGYNRTAPGGIPNAAGVAIPGTAGSRNCGACYAPYVFVPGVVDPRTRLWVTPPACRAPSAGGGSALPLAVAAIVALKFML